MSTSSTLPSSNVPWIPRPVSIALIQMAMENDKLKNLDKAITLIKSASEKGAKIICLPELFRSPYFPAVPKDSSSMEAWAEPIDGETYKRFEEVCRDRNIVIVGGSIFEEDSSGFYNTSLVVGPNGLIGTYRKNHIPHDPSFFERDYFKEGDLKFPVFSTPFGKVGVLICYDQWFPEAARLMALNGAEIIFYPTAIATCKDDLQVEGSWQEAWEAAQRGHAICNNVIVATVNRVGSEGSMDFWGGSFIYNAFGKCIAHAGNDEEVLVASVDPGHSGFCRQSWRFFASRRPQEYSEIARAS